MLGAELILRTAQANLAFQVISERYEYHRPVATS